MQRKVSSLDIAFAHWSEAQSCRDAVNDCPCGKSHLAIVRKFDPVRVDEWERHINGVLFRRDHVQVPV